MGNPLVSGIKERKNAVGTTGLRRFSWIGRKAKPPTFPHVSLKSSTGPGAGSGTKQAPDEE